MDPYRSSVYIGYVWEIRDRSATERGKKSYPMTSSSGEYSGRSSVSPVSSWATELNSADSWFRWTARRVEITSRGHRMPVLKRAMAKYMVRLRGEKSWGIESSTESFARESEGSSRWRRSRRPMTT